MKRLFLTVVAVLSMTMAFAEDENLNSVNKSNAYDMTINYGKLGQALGLSADQLDAVEDVHKVFCADMLSVSAATKESRKLMMDNAIKKDLRYMRYILDNEQYHKYLVLLNATINNRGLNK